MSPLGPTRVNETITIRLKNRSRNHQKSYLYIMQKTYYKPLVIWLAIGAIMVAAMVVIGGVTRLTDSGLSMVDWNLFSGTIPPQSEVEWLETFDNYKNYPEYNLVNFEMSLSEFKSIFFWEWFHRVLGRTIGVVFIIPFFWFLYKKKLSPKLTKKLVILLFLGGFQGFLGWFMVKSGLVDRPDVSHFRLALHLSAAFLTFAYIFWLLLELTSSGDSEDLKLTKLAKWYKIFVPLVVLQIIFGAFVAGLDAGLVFPTWPRMGSYWIPPQIGADISSKGISSLWNEKVSVQFLHRVLAYIVFIFTVFLWVKSRGLKDSLKSKMGMSFLMIAVLIQVILGIFTLLMKVPISLGVLHQFGALLVLMSIVYQMFLARNNEIAK